MTASPTLTGDLWMVRRDIDEALFSLRDWRQASEQQRLAIVIIGLEALLRSVSVLARLVEERES